MSTSEQKKADETDVEFCLVCQNVLEGEIALSTI
jgi:hypothetical protein